MGCRKLTTTMRGSAGSLSVDVAGREGQKPLCGFPTGITRIEKLELMGLSHMLEFWWLTSYTRYQGSALLSHRQSSLS